MSCVLQIVSDLFKLGSAPQDAEPAGGHAPPSARRFLFWTSGRSSTFQIKSACAGLAGRFLDRPGGLSYSCRNASIGSMRVARMAGT